MYDARWGIEAFYEKLSSVCGQAWDRTGRRIRFEAPGVRARQPEHYEQR